MYNSIHTTNLTSYLSLSLFRDPKLMVKTSGLRMWPENRPNHSYLTGNDFLREKRDSSQFTLFTLCKNY